MGTFLAQCASFRLATPLLRVSDRSCCRSNGGKLGFTPLCICTEVPGTLQKEAKPSQTHRSIAQPFYSLSLFLPVIITGLGFSGPQANALSTPPYFLGFLTTLIACWYSDRIQKRGIILVACMGTCCIGYIILLAQYKPAVSYFATFLCVGGVSPSIALAIVWVGGQFGPVVRSARIHRKIVQADDIL